ncbi:MAG: adenylosuccinate synthetase [Eubacterium sp.]|nr:adenylosuccinate synthetase [Eubacterium sp.]
MEAIAVIGNGFGDEGKGLAVDYLAREAQQRDAACLVLRHNGGAQAGHTVDLPDRRFVFHQLSSGSFRGADTLWTATFLPDLYKLREELDAFTAVSGHTPRLYADKNCCCTTVDDVLVNMALETARGDSRHGSCGMGINEATERVAAGFGITLEEIQAHSAAQLATRLTALRRDYLPERLQQLGLTAENLGEYGELLHNTNLPFHAAEEMKKAAEAVSLTDGMHAAGYDRIVFEGAQGLLLDADNQAYAPHVTASKTGLHNPVHFCRQHLSGTALTALYVARAYVTRHGAGPLPEEDASLWQQYGILDETNRPNEWQGSLRTARYASCKAFAAAATEDQAEAALPVNSALLLTHLNETAHTVLLADGDRAVTAFCRECHITACYPTVYLSASPYAQDITRFS